MLDWSRDELAERCGVAKRTIVRFEAAEGETRASTLEVIRRAFEMAGIQFIPENGGGVGVRKRKPSP